MFVLFNIKLDDDPLTLIPSIIFGDNSILVAPAGRAASVSQRPNTSPSCIIQ